MVDKSLSLLHKVSHVPLTLARPGHYIISNVLQITGYYHVLYNFYQRIAIIMLMQCMYIVM